MPACVHGHRQPTEVTVAWPLQVQSLSWISSKFDECSAHRTSSSHLSLVERQHCHITWWWNGQMSSGYASHGAFHKLVKWPLRTKNILNSSTLSSTQPAK